MNEKTYINNMTTIRLSIPEKRYARALSLRLGNCRLKETGSAAYALKYLLHERAKAERIDIGEIYTS